MTGPGAARGANGQAEAGLADGTRVRVVAGSPTAEELAAVVLALDAAAPSRRGAAPAPSQRPPWLLAARREAVGGRPVAGPADLHGWERG